MGRGVQIPFIQPGRAAAWPSIGTSSSTTGSCCLCGVRLSCVCGYVWALSTSHALRVRFMSQLLHYRKRIAVLSRAVILLCRPLMACSIIRRACWEADVPARCLSPACSLITLTAVLDDNALEHDVGLTGVPVCAATMYEPASYVLLAAACCRARTVRLRLAMRAHAPALEPALPYAHATAQPSQLNSRAGMQDHSPGADARPASYCCCLPACLRTRACRRRRETHNQPTGGGGNLICQPSRLRVLRGRGANSIHAAPAAPCCCCFTQGRTEDIRWPVQGAASKAPFACHAVARAPMHHHTPSRLGPQPKGQRPAAGRT